MHNIFIFVRTWWWLLESCCSQPMYSYDLRHVTSCYVMLRYVTSIGEILVKDLIRKRISVATALLKNSYNDKILRDFKKKLAPQSPRFSWSTFLCFWFLYFYCDISIVWKRFSGLLQNPFQFSFLVDRQSLTKIVRLEHLPHYPILIVSFVAYSLSALSGMAFTV